MPERLSSKPALALFLAAVASLLPAEARADEDREVILHGFRAPSMGVELKQGFLGFHVGLYPQIADKNDRNETRTTWFIKTGVTFYPVGFDAGPGRPSGPYLGMALVQGLNNAWNVSDSVGGGTGGFLDAGFRWAAYRGLDLRLGVGVLLGSGGRAVVVPTPGVSWATRY
jgi:hypothetical protein